MAAVLFDDPEETARWILSLGIEPSDLELEPDLSTLPAEVLLTADLQIPFPPDLAPLPQQLIPFPSPTAPLPKADVVVVTWTIAELRALCDVFTPGFGRAKWPRYNRNFAQYLPKIAPQAPAQNAQRLGSYFPTKIGTKNVLCIKSELHLARDAITISPGTATLPVRDLWAQIIEEAQPRYIFTIGTSGSVRGDCALGDVVVTRGAKFRLTKRFKNEPFNGQTYTSQWTIPTRYFDKAAELMQRFASDLLEPPVGPPHLGFQPKHFAKAPPNTPKIHCDDNHDMPEFHPILTTDYFEFGTTTNNLDKEGAACEMGDAVLGLVASEMETAPKWAVVRNMSDPLINGNLSTREYHLNLQTLWAVAYYEAYGYFTSVNGALATWAIIAGLP
jgi:nucleoside phosphorylase